ncbi:Wzz/FepE/Etk N-terminal domain-containing protein [Bacillus sp. FJAT-50079]|uniref:Wzz/FepE/Etk N-terminal domain-containing protein n=1 Tax=Bacillus sp. FJAT-50079 TaxID=2833577 RepID=UPI001BC936EE|nr:Wzz/FepE/Etk N-terminal domain-containing protein [Bacillus sp. FJAT-50079]MBS4206753.1 hypothetical protein [Bacillus sp. FJAT-50079]
MASEKYILYDYLTFIWKKKWFVLLFTIICGGAGIFFSLSQTHIYESEAVIFVGNAGNDELTKPENIIFYKEELEGPYEDQFSVTIPRDFQVILKLKGIDEQKVFSQLNKVAESYVSDLNDTFNKKRSRLEDYYMTLEAKVESLQKVIDHYNDQLLNSKVPDSQIADYTGLVIEYESQRESYQERINNLGQQLDDMEGPKLSGINTTSSGSKLFRNLFLAMAFGFQCGLVILVFWKYMLNARKASE